MNVPISRRPGYAPVPPLTPESSERLEHFVRHDIALLYSLAIPMTHDDQEADDLVAHTLFLIARGLALGQIAPNALKKYACVTLRHAWWCELAYRRRRPAEPYEFVPDEDDAAVLVEAYRDLEPGPESVVAEAFLKASIRQAIGRLTPRRREAVEARFAERDVASAAERVGMAKSDLKRHFRAACADLREPLAEVLA